MRRVTSTLSVRICTRGGLSSESLGGWQLLDRDSPVQPGRRLAGLKARLLSGWRLRLLRDEGGTWRAASAPTTGFWHGCHPWREGTFALGQGALKP
jgi:hypothetical protein